MPTSPRWTINVAVKEAALRAEMVMKRLAIFSAILILSAAAALAQSGPHSTRFSNPLLNDVVRMTKGGMPDATIVAYVKARRGHRFGERGRSNAAAPSQGRRASDPVLRRRGAARRRPHRGSSSRRRDL